MKKGAGFTLIELLVVIAIIAILAAILFPIFAHARSVAVRARCASNTRQLGIATRIYASDFNGSLPQSLFPGMWGKVTNKWGYPCVTWADEIYPYIKNYAVFSCPAHYAIDAKQFPSVKIIAYGFNHHLMLDNVLKESQTVFPTRTVLLSETVGNGEFVWAEEFWYSAYVANKYHQDGRANWVFCDGHAANMKPSQTVYPRMMWNAACKYPWAYSGLKGDVSFGTEAEAQAAFEKNVKDQGIVQW